MSLITVFFNCLLTAVDDVQGWHSRSLDSVAIPGCSERPVLSGVNWIDWLESADVIPVGHGEDESFWGEVSRDLSGLIVQGEDHVDYVKLQCVASIRSCKTDWWKKYHWSLSDFGASLVEDVKVEGDRSTLMKSVLEHECPSIIDDDWRRGLHWDNGDGGHRIAICCYLDGLHDKPFWFPANVRRRSLSRAAASRLSDQVAFVVSDNLSELSSFSVRLARAGVGCAVVEPPSHQRFSGLAGAVAIDTRSRAVQRWLDRKLAIDSSLLVINPAQYL